MNKESPAEKHERYVQFAAEHYRETFINIVAHEAEGGRFPGVAQVSETEIKDFFREKPPEAWQQMARQNPAHALRQLREFERLEKKAGYAG